MLALSSEFVNDLGSRYHLAFARTNYFDKNGVFITTMFSIPLLVLMMVTVVCFLEAMLDFGGIEADRIRPQIVLLIQLSRTMIKAKRLQLQRKAKGAKSQN